MKVIENLNVEVKKSRKRRNPNDKILDNAYNKGDLDFSNLGVPTADYTSKLLPTTYNYEDFRQNELYEELYSIYEKSSFYTKNKDKKFLKKDLLDIFICLSKPLLAKGYSYIEVFTSIAEFLRVDYKLLYQTIPNTIKTPILQECGEKFSHIQLISSKKLF